MKDYPHYLVGIAILAIYTIHFLVHVFESEVDHMLWMCNVSMVCLGVTIVWRGPVLLTQVCSVWLMMGIPLWLVAFLGNEGFKWTTFLVHIGGPLLALYTLYWVRFEWSIWSVWAASIAFYLIIHFASALVTDPALNINLSHQIWPGWEETFSSYLTFWLAYNGILFPVLLAISAGLNLLFPNSQ